MPCALPSAGSKLAAKSDRTRLRGLSHALAVPPAFVSKAIPTPVPMNMLFRLYPGTVFAAHPTSVKANKKENEFSPKKLSRAPCFAKNTGKRPTN